MKYNKDSYTKYDPFFPEECTLECRKVKIVKVRKEHDCFEGLCPGHTPHKIKIGELARFESALVDGDFFGKYYICIPCMDKLIDEMHPEQEDDVE